MVQLDGASSSLRPIDPGACHPHLPHLLDSCQLLSRPSESSAGDPAAHQGSSIGHSRQLIKVPFHRALLPAHQGSSPYRALPLCGRALSHFLALALFFSFSASRPPVTPVTPVTPHVGRSVGLLLHYYFPYKKLPKSVIYFYLCHIILSIFTA